MTLTKYLVLGSFLALAACGNKDSKQTEEEKKEMETVTDQIRKDSIRADSAFRAMQKRIEDAKQDTSVKLVEPKRD